MGYLQNVAVVGAGISVLSCAYRLKQSGLRPLVLVSSAYQRRQIAHPLDGFGFMVPRREGLQLICTFWNSSLFPNPAPSENVFITSFSGRELPAADSTPDGVAQVIEAENARILGIHGAPLDRVVWHNRHALPQYNVGHARRVEQISSTLATLPNLHLAGNFLKGRSIGECVELTSRVANDMHSQVQGQNI